MQSKKLLRQTIKSKLNKLSAEQIKLYSDSVFLQLSEKINNYKTRFVYLPTPQEIQTDKFIKLLRKKGKTVLVPKINDKDEIIPVEYKSGLPAGAGSKLILGKYNILEVENGQEFKGKIDITIVPGMAFTKDGKRLGRGKGYYDKFLNKHKKIFKIGLGFSEQIVKNIPIQSHDILMDKVIIPNNIEFDKYEKALHYEIFVNEEYKFIKKNLGNPLNLGKSVVQTIFDIGGHIGLLFRNTA